MAQAIVSDADGRLPGAELFGGRWMIKKNRQLLMDNHLEPITFSKAALLLIIWHWIFRCFRLYDSGRLVSRSREAVYTFMALALGCLLVSVTVFIVNTRLDTAQLISVFCVSSLGLTVSSRLLPRWLLEPGDPAVTNRPSRSGDCG